MSATKPRPAPVSEPRQSRTKATASTTVNRLAGPAIGITYGYHSSQSNISSNRVYEGESQAQRSQKQDRDLAHWFCPTWVEMYSSGRCYSRRPDGRLIAGRSGCLFVRILSKPRMCEMVLGLKVHDCTVLLPLIDHHRHIGSPLRLILAHGNTPGLHLLRP